MPNTDARSGDSTIRLCLALPTFYPVFGGGSLRFLRYQPGLRERGVQGWVLAGTPRAKDITSIDTSAWNAAPLGTILPPETVDDTPVRRVRLPDRTGVQRTRIYFERLIEFCADETTRPDVVQLHSFERIEVFRYLRRLRRMGVPLVYAVQIARPPAREGSLKEWAMRRFRRAFFDAFDAVVTNSEDVGTEIVGTGTITPVEVIPNGVDSTRFAPSEGAAVRAARAALHLPEGVPVVLSVGAVSERKGTDLLISAWRRVEAVHPDAQLLIAGPRHDQANDKQSEFGAKLASLVDGLRSPGNVHFLGVVEDMPPVYRAADLMVLPTSREGSPNAVFEAMASERAVLLTPFTGLSDALGEAGREFELCERTAEAIGERMVDLLGDAGRRQRLARDGRAWVVSRMRLDDSLDRYAALYRDTIRRVGAS